MADLYGRLRAYNKEGQQMSGEATRIAHGSIGSSVETWEGALRTELEVNGDFTVFLAEKYGTGKPVIVGNINEMWWKPIGQKQRRAIA